MIKCRIFTGTKFEDEKGEIKFVKEQVGKSNVIDKGYIDYYDEKEFKLRIQKYAHLMGFSVDAYDKDDKIFWSNYREESELDKLRKEYLELSGEEADKRWKENKLSDEINKLKND